LANVGHVEVAFGGSDFFGHGVDVVQGTVRFAMTNYTLE